MGQLWAVAISERTGLLCDWVGTVIMTGPIWAWIYDKIRQRLEAQSAAAGSTIKLTTVAAIGTLWIANYNKARADKGKVTFLRNFLDNYRTAKARAVYWLVKTIASAFLAIARFLESLFAGGVGLALFLFGFLLWNWAKYVSWTRLP